MKYQLKNQKLQKKLDDISDGDFTIQLQQLDKDPLKPLTGICVSFGEKVKGLSEKFNGRLPKFVVRLAEDEIEEIPEYDPAAWNEFPSVEPPPNTLLRIEVVTEQIGKGTPEPSGGKVRCRGCATYSHGFWMLGEKITVKPRETVRFRPWDDTTATLSKKMLQEIVTALESHPEAYELGDLIDAVDEAANELPDEEGEE